MRGRPANSLLIAILAFIILAAAFFFVQQLTRGLSVTGLHKPVFWGLYVVSFAFLFGMGAGALWLAAFLNLRGRRFGSAAFLSAVIALVSLMLAGIFVLVDLGRIDRFYYLVLYGRIQSPLVWDFVIMQVFLLLNLILICLMARRAALDRDVSKEKMLPPRKWIFSLLTLAGEKRLGDKVLATLCRIALVAVPVLYFATSRVFGIVRARPEWTGVIMGLIFVVSAALSAVSILLLVATLLERRPTVSGFDPFMRNGLNWLLVIIPVDLALTLCHWLAMRANPLIGVEYHLFPFAPALEIVLGMILPFALIILYRKRERVPCISICAIILAGVFLKRSSIIIPVFFRRWLPFPEARYAPTLPEVGITLGICALGIVILAVLLFLLSPAGLFSGATNKRRLIERAAARPHISPNEKGCAPD